MELLTQNGKMKRSSNSQYTIFNFGIPAYKSRTGMRTCPWAGNCAKEGGCYALNGPYRWGTVKNAYEERLEVTKSREFHHIMDYEIKKKAKTVIKKGKQVVVRVHDSGDFYSAKYFNKWMKVAEMNKDVKFYAYTKAVSLSKRLTPNIPSNFKIGFSFGGKEDHLIDKEKDIHSMVFAKEVPSAYEDASHDDLVFALSTNNKIGLVYHGPKRGDFSDV